MEGSLGRRRELVLSAVLVAILTLIAGYAATVPDWRGSMNAPGENLPETVPDGRAAMQINMLVLPDQCVTAMCFWRIPVGLFNSEWKGVLLTLYPGLAASTRNHELTGVVGPVTVSDVVSVDTPEHINGILVETYPSGADRFFDISQTLPQAVIPYFGVPDHAYLHHLRGVASYWLTLSYSDKAFVYEVWGSPQDNQVCLTPSQMESVTLYRFKDADTAARYLHFRGIDSGQSFEQATGQPVESLVAGASAPERNCFRLLEP